MAGLGDVLARLEHLLVEDDVRHALHAVDHAVLQREVGLAPGHGHRARADQAEGAEERLGLRDPDLQPLEILHRPDVLGPRHDVAEPLGARGEDADPGLRPETVPDLLADGPVHHAVRVGVVAEHERHVEDADRGIEVRQDAGAAEGEIDVPDLEPFLKLPLVAELARREDLDLDLAARPLAHHVREPLGGRAPAALGRPDVAEAEGAVRGDGRREIERDQGEEQDSQDADRRWHGCLPR